MEEAPDGRRERTGRIQACDNCKDRKTRCDRATPCSSCVTANLTCRMTRTRPEKRQRIVISAKYDEALESVDHRLQEVLETVTALQRDVSRSPAAAQQSLQRASDFPAGSAVALLSGSSNTSGGYRAYPSFDAQVRRMAAAHLPQRPSENGTASSNIIQEILEWTANSGTIAPQSRIPSALPFLEQHPELASYTMPPSDVVLRLLRLARVEKQRFFADVGFLDEQQFTELCREIFFAVHPYSLCTWSLVNTGLLHLFLDLDPDRYADVGLEAHEVENIAELLAKNSQASAESFRMSFEPSIEACQAMALAGTSCAKLGHLTKAWNLISAASRMCTDLGLHRLPTVPFDEDEMKKRVTFWYLYIWDKGLALTLGRTQSIHQYDVSTERMVHPFDIRGIAGKTAAAFQELAVLEGEIQPLLFSVSSQQINLHVRAQRSREIRARLKQIRAELSKVNDERTSIVTFSEATVLVEYLLSALVTVVCSTVALELPDHNSNQPGHACAECVDAARHALEIIVKSGNAIKEMNPSGWIKGWTFFMNTFLSLMPFTPYIVLVVHAVSEFAVADLDLLASVVSLMEPIAERSSTIRPVYEICAKLYQFAESTIRPRMEDSSVQTTASTEAAFAGYFEPGLMSLHGSVSPTDSNPAPLMSLGDFQMMLGGLDMDGRQS
ncbi:hypothetical protein GGS23DRAFT_608138 [Durotheca rogersii]|uniref:uncharacterized protein n=1 Tax=Durotheca rogersii TaxID=419775 RepID=UPI00221E3B9F|nr:uncharacterized protein GGS23DRAFT_608138 [Durotheca rogersii]KAI5855612.1 hypothetical protein GGS23DRAFT_608138 [Durotheca rogersii]